MTTDSQVWIIDDDRSIRWVLEKSLQGEGLSVESFDCADKAIEALDNGKPEAIISDVRMPGTNGLEFLQQIQDTCPEIPVIIMTAHSDLDSAVASYQSGAFDYMPKPFDIDDAISLTRRALEHSLQLKNSRQQKQEVSVVEPVDSATEIIGEAPAMQEVFRAIGRLSHSNITVLINGESGTGKELVARALHRHSPRAAKPFIALNMAAIPNDLIESELFGHEKGAFTGAGAMRKGRFEQAGNGTLFLDEIGDMPADTQTRLLRVLADGEFYRVGGHTPVKADVRIIAATHQDLETLVSQGKFREDLFHRLNVIRVHLPKLCERSEDIPVLARHFLDRAAQELNVETKILTPETESYIALLPWPGNVRQLENTCRWLTVMASGREVLISDLPPELLNKELLNKELLNKELLDQDQQPRAVQAGSWEQRLKQWAEKELAIGNTNILEKAVPAFERILIESALQHTSGRKRDASELLGWGRNTLTRKIKELGISDKKVTDKSLTE